jgi:hypothetical protein
VAAAAQTLSSATRVSHALLIRTHQAVGLHATVWAFVSRTRFAAGLLGLSAQIKTKFVMMMKGTTVILRREDRIVRACV